MLDVSGKWLTRYIESLKNLVIQIQIQFYLK